MNTILGDLTADQLRRAATIKEELDTLNAELESLLGGQPVVPAEPAAKRRGGMSAAGRAAVAAGARKRWAKYYADQEAVEAKPSKFSPAARARLSRLAKARWAKVRAAGGSAIG